MPHFCNPISKKHLQREGRIAQSRAGGFQMGLVQKSSFNEDPEETSRLLYLYGSNEVRENSGIVFMVPVTY